MTATLNLHGVTDIRIEQDVENRWYTITFLDARGNELLEVTAFPNSDGNGKALPSLKLEGFTMVPMEKLVPQQPEQHPF